MSSRLPSSRKTVPDDAVTDGGSGGGGAGERRGVDTNITNSTSKMAQS